MKLTKGQIYDVSALICTGWTAVDGSLIDGYNVDDYFDHEGRYLGPDEHGIEPEFAPNDDLYVRMSAGVLTIGSGASAAQSAHTPGPWKITGHYLPEGFTVSDDGRNTIATVHNHIGGAYAANARLIASAPQLLAVLEKCDLAFANWQVGQIPGRSEDILSLITEVRAALAAATQGTP